MNTFYFYVYWRDILGFDVQADLEKEEESKKLLREQLNELENVRQQVESSMSAMRTQQEDHEKKMNHTLKVRQDLEEHLQLEREKVASLSLNLEQTTTRLQVVEVELCEAKTKLDRCKGSQNNMEKESKESRP